tara:strand:+ start:879 stop:1544 length:666 start_codon:yes stop_codon:yes gene_type:complete
MEENIIGGVSPIKAKRAGRRGKTSGKGRRGVGDTRYKRDKWKKPASGGTMTIPRKMGELPPAPIKPYKIKDGKVVPNNVTNNYYGDNMINQSGGGGSESTTTTTPDTEDVYETKEVKTVKPYSTEWDIKKAGGLTYAEWIKKPGNRAQEKKFVDGQTKTTLERVLVSEGKKGSSITTTKKTNGGGHTATINSRQGNGIPMLGSPGKYSLGGYRAMKENRKK